MRFRTEFYSCYPWRTYAHRCCIMFSTWTKHVNYEHNYALYYSRHTSQLQNSWCIISFRSVLCWWPINMVYWEKLFTILMLKRSNWSHNVTSIHTLGDRIPVSNHENNIQVCVYFRDFTGVSCDSLPVDVIFYSGE